MLTCRRQSGSTLVTGILRTRPLSWFTDTEALLITYRLAFYAMVNKNVRIISFEKRLDKEPNDLALLLIIFSNIISQLIGEFVISVYKKWKL